MQDAKTEIINNILLGLYQDIDYDVSKKLEGLLYMNLSQYEVSKKTTDIIPYNEDTTNEILKRFLISKKLKNLSERSLKYYNTTARKVFESIGKNPMNITVDDIRMYILKRQLEDKVSDVTINSEMRTLSSLFAWMATEEIRLQNPMLKIDKLKEKKKKKEAFTEYELEFMRSNIKDVKNKALFEVLVSTWARVSEIANIKLEDINEDQVIVHGKGNKDRYVYLTPRARIAISKYLECRKDDNPYLFPRKVEHCQGRTVVNWYMNKDLVDENDHTDIGTIELFIRMLGRKLGIAAHPHKFRRTGATMALRRGMSLIQVSKTLGHESIDTTQIYLDIGDNELKDAHMKYC